MKLPWLTTTLLSLTVTLTACATPNQTYCDTDDMCPGDSICDVEAHHCVSNPTPDAGDEEVVDTADASPTCDGEGQQCIAAAPEGWIGPIAKTEAAAGDVTPNCDGDFSQDVGLFGANIVESGSCDCECGRSTSLSCGVATLREWTVANTEPECEMGVCPVIGGGCLNNDQQSFSAGVCTSLSNSMRNEDYLRIRFGQILGGTCEPAVASGELSSAFATQVRLCQAAANPLGCAEGENCAPRSPEEFVDGLCIMRQGIHDCPTDLGYSEQTVLHTAIDDTRSCSATSCTCGVLSGSCRGKFELYQGGSDGETCGSPLATLEPATSIFGQSNYCEAPPPTAQAGKYIVDPTAGTCSTTGGQASIAGEAVGTGTQTLCCMP